MICINATLTNNKHMNSSEFLVMDSVENPTLMVLRLLSRTKVSEAVDATGIIDYLEVKKMAEKRIDKLFWYNSILSKTCCLQSNSHS